MSKKRKSVSGTKLRQMRLLSGKTLQEVADAIKISRSSVCQQEKRGIFDIRTAEKYAVALNCSAIFLLERLNVRRRIALNSDAVIVDDFEETLSVLFPCGEQIRGLQAAVQGVLGSGLNFRPVLHEVERGVLLPSIRLVPDSAKRFQRYGVSVEFGPPHRTQGVTLFQKFRRIVNRRDRVNLLL